ncbi:MAG: hypothetical protein OEM62_00540, partial [Acidobacteriota bacterium]|nr:hypothetical protein [Acidobacteriota bacterium]
MAITRDTRKLIESGRFDDLEDEWLSQISEEPLKLDYFVGTARALAGAGEDERSRQLLELLDEHLTAEGEIDTRLELLERAGHLLLANEEERLHGVIIDTLVALYAASDVREPLMKRLGLHRAVSDIPKTWKKVKQLRTLMSYDRGAVVWMEGQGVGEIVDVNVELEKLRIDLTGKSSISVGFGAAAKMLKPLPESHFLYRKVRHADPLRRLAAEDPPAALRLLLESVDAPLSASAIRDAVSGLIDESAWSSWWTAARQHPQVVTSGKGARQKYAWAASSGEASEETLRSFDVADLPGKLEILRREVKRGSETSQVMAETLHQLAVTARPKDPAKAFTVAATLEAVLGTAPQDLVPAHILEEAADPVGLTSDLTDKNLRRRALTLLQEARDDWVEICAQLMDQESDPRLLTELATPLAQADPGRLAEVFDGIVAHPRRHAPAFVWLAEQLPEFPFLEGRNPLRLMQLILGAQNAREFAAYRSRLAKLIESSPTLPHLIAKLDSEQAARAEEILERAPYEEYVRQPLINALHLRFPELVGEPTDLLYATTESIDGRRGELKRLLDEEIPANRRAIEEARALGDLRENFEYKSA